MGLLYVCVLIGHMADALLAPYYPQYFLAVYGIDDPQYVALLIASCRFVMVFAYPLWAILSKKVSTFALLVVTQGISGGVILSAIWAPNEQVFLLLAMVHVAFKSSTLLLYPLIVHWAGQERRTNAVSGYGFITHLAAVIAALVGGYFLMFFDPRYLLLLPLIRRVGNSSYRNRLNPRWRIGRRLKRAIRFQLVACFGWCCCITPR
ncbi:MAG: MFS transporter [Exilibacterium sp.]